jgi:hypothetical protein
MTPLGTSGAAELMHELCRRRDAHPHHADGSGQFRGREVSAKMDPGRKVFLLIKNNTKNLTSTLTSFIFLLKRFLTNFVSLKSSFTK